MSALLDYTKNNGNNYEAFHTSDLDQSFKSFKFKGRSFLN